MGLRPTRKAGGHEVYSNEALARLSRSGHGTDGRAATQKILRVEARHPLFDPTEERLSRSWIEGLELSFRRAETRAEAHEPRDVPLVLDAFDPDTSRDEACGVEETSDFLGRIIGQPSAGPGVPSILGPKVG
jgi:hypothetical protein